MKKKVLEEMNREDFFKPSRRKMEAMRKKKLKEQKEKNEQKKNEENKKIEEDIKNGKDVGLSDKFKFWFRSNIGGLFDSK